MNILDQICMKKQKHIARKKAQVPLGILKEKIKNKPDKSDFIQKIKSANNTAIIAEVKKASPSKGIIREDFDPVQIAQLYKHHGATCISVLTDEPYFKGHDLYLEQIRNTIDLPLLRKDFIIDPYQIYESRALGADCILLIMAAITDAQAKELYDLSCRLGMDVLVEIHNNEELERTKTLNPAMIGINNRNLKTLEVNAQTALDLIPHIPAHIVKIAESGISSPETIKAYKKAGFHGFLIGEFFMRQPDIGAALDHIRK